MQKREVGSTANQVSVVCLGTMLFGRPIAQSESVRLMQAALDLGINLFDTADIYEGYDRYSGSAGGVAESILGEALLGRRTKGFIMTRSATQLAVNMMARV